jgi:thimet oligopeptidase
VTSRFSWRRAAALVLLPFLPLSSGAAATTGATELTLNWQLTPAQISATCRDAIALASRRLTALTRVPQGKRTFTSVVAPIETAFADLSDSTAAQQFLANVSVDPKVRDASLQCETNEGTFQSEITARPAFYAVLHDAATSNTARGDEQKKLTQIWLTASFRSGAGLPAAKRAAFVKLNAHLTDLQNRFGANLNNDQTTIVITKAQAAGLSPDFVATFKTQGDGYVVPVGESTDSPFLSNASDESARKTFAVAYANRGGAKNVALLEEAIATRDRLAHLFGYPTWAAYVLADRMAQTPARVDRFLQNIDTAIIGKAKSDLDALSALKGSPVEPWDVGYYANVLRKQKYAVDTDAIKQYFPVQHTIDAVLGIYSRLLSVRFTPISKPDVWNDEVLGYDVADGASGAYIGRFYLDLYPRPGKFNHFANFPIITRRVLPDGGVRAPLAIIVGNWSRPASGKPALLTHGEVETFFHEFGHNMAAMLATGDYQTLTSGFRQDFVEAPSQMLENWVWNPAILKELSSNVVTGAPLPDDLIAKMIAARYFDYALYTTQQVLYSTVDMRYHTLGAHVDTTAVWKETQARTTPIGYIDGTIPQAAFGHLMSGYDAGYYGYLWSKVYAQDMFTAFQSAGLENPEVGLRYRRDILAPARTYEPDAEVAKLLGRPMNPNAFYSELGITPPAR